MVSVKKSGGCFGYDGLINKAHRTSTTIALQDTDLFVLSGEHFDKCFNKSILKNDIERKEFLMNKIKTFKLNKQYFDLRFKYIKTHNKSNNDIIYSEGSKVK